MGPALMPSIKRSYWRWPSRRKSSATNRDDGDVMFCNCIDSLLLRVSRLNFKFFKPWHCTTTFQFGCDLQDIGKVRAIVGEEDPKTWSDRGVHRTLCYVPS